MNKAKCRIVKISKDALYEFLYENFIAQQEDMLEVDPLKVANRFAIDWEDGSFIFCAHVCEDENENFIPFPKDVDIKEVLKKIPDTTVSALSPKPYKEYSFEELRELSLTKK